MLTDAVRIMHIPASGQPWVLQEQSVSFSISTSPPGSFKFTLHKYEKPRSSGPG